MGPGLRFAQIEHLSENEGNGGSKGKTGKFDANGSGSVFCRGIFVLCGHGACARKARAADGATTGARRQASDGGSAAAGGTAERAAGGHREAFRGERRRVCEGARAIWIQKNN